LLGIKISLTVWYTTVHGEQYLDYRYSSTELSNNAKQFDFLTYLQYVVILEFFKLCLPSAYA